MTLSYSAFELFKEILPLRNAKATFDQYRAQDAIASIKQIHDHYHFFMRISQEVTGRNLITSVNNFLSGHEICITSLAMAVRHIFIHGDLTPHASSAKPLAVKQICNILADKLLEVMDEEFTKKVFSS